MSKTPHIRESEMNVPANIRTDQWSPVPKQDVHVTKDPPKKTPGVSADQLTQMIQENADRLNDSRGIMELLPDVELIAELLTASILSPKDLNEVKLTIQMENGAIQGFAEAVENYFRTDYPLEAKLPKILSDALIKEGSYPIFPIPPSTIHRLIKENTFTMESLDQSLNKVTSDGSLGLLYLGTHGSNNYGLAMESLSSVHIPYAFDIDDYERSSDGSYNAGTSYQARSFTDERVVVETNTGDKDLVTITDNPLLLLRPVLLEAIKDSNRQQKVESWFSTEDYTGGQDDKKHLKSLKRFFKQQHRLTLDGDTDIKTDFDELFEQIHPPTLELPPESVVPVTRPGQVEEPIGFYIALDARGNAVSKVKDANFFKNLKRKIESATKKDPNTNKTLEKAIGYMNDVSNNGILKEDSIYEQELDKQLREAVEKGEHNDTVEVRAPTEFYRLMFSRQLRHQKTRILYVPAELMTYYAFNYDSNGVGISLIQKNKLYAQLRAVMTFAYTLAGIKNSVGSRKILITLDEDDPDGRVTVETLLAEYYNLNSDGNILTSSSPSDIISNLQRMQVQVEIEGGSVLPNTKMEVQENQRDIGKPDDLLDDLLKKQLYNGLWTTVEAVDRSYEGDFATGLVQSNLLAARRYLKAQSVFENFTVDFIQKYIQAGGPLLKKLKELYIAAKETTKDLPEFADCIRSLKVVLPKPDMAKLDVHLSALEQYESLVDKGLEFQVNEEMLSDILEGEHTSVSIDNLRSMIKGRLMRQYMIDKNILPEMTKAFTKGSDLTDMIIADATSVQDQIKQVLLKLKPKDVKDDDKITKAITKAEDNLDVEESENPVEPNDEDQGEDLDNF